MLGLIHLIYIVDANSMGSQSDVDQLVLYDDDGAGLTADGCRVSMDYSSINGFQHSIFGGENHTKDRNGGRYEHRSSLPHVGKFFI